MKVSARALKSRFDEYLVRVRAGERVVVTVRGKPVAEVTPVGRARNAREAREEALARMVERGELRLPKGNGLEDFEPVRVRGRPVSETIIEDRG
jgi:prevent-host-death family protein